MVSFVIKGRPISVRARATTRHTWTQKVAAAARVQCSAPLTDQNLRIKITFFYNTEPDFDTDNISKPICDALNGVAYVDDHQISDRHVRRRDIGSPYRIRGANPDLAVAIAEGEDFVHIEIDQLEVNGEQL